MDNLINDIDSSWIIVKRKHNTKISFGVKTEKKLTVTEITQKISDIITPFYSSINTVILHGSTGINMHRYNSDIDIAIIWNIQNFEKKLNTIYTLLSDSFNNNIDITSYIYAETIKKYDFLIKKYSFLNNENNINFTFNVKSKGYLIYGNINNLDSSVYALHSN